MREALLELAERLHWVDERHLLEFCLLDDGHKAVVRVPVVSDSELARLRDFSEMVSASLVISRRKTVVDFRNELGEEFVRWVEISDHRPGEFVAYLGRTPAFARSAEEAEYEEDNTRLADLLGYPACCSIHYATITGGGRWIENLLSASPPPSCPWEANKLAYALYGASLFPDYFPCGLTCSGTITLARAAFASLEAPRTGLSRRAPPRVDAAAGPHRREPHLWLVEIRGRGLRRRVARGPRRLAIGSHHAQRARWRPLASYLPIFMIELLDIDLDAGCSRYGEKS